MGDGELSGISSMSRVANVDKLIKCVGHPIWTTAWEFWIEKQPVTFADYERFVKECNWMPPLRRHLDPNRLESRKYGWNMSKQFSSKVSNCSINHVSWYSALAYAEWSGKSLPTVFEWVQYAAVTLGAGKSCDPPVAIDASLVSGWHPGEDCCCLQIPLTGVSDVHQARKALMLDPVREEWVYHRPEDVRGFSQLEPNPRFDRMPLNEASEPGSGTVRRCTVGLTGTGSRGGVNVCVRARNPWEVDPYLGFRCVWRPTVYCQGGKVRETWP